MKIILGNSKTDKHYLEKWNRRFDDEEEKEKEKEDDE